MKVAVFKCTPNLLFISRFLHELCFLSAVTPDFLMDMIAPMESKIEASIKKKVKLHFFFAILLSFDLNMKVAVFKCVPHH